LAIKQKTKASNKQNRRREFWFEIHQRYKRHFSRLIWYLIPIPMCFYSPSGRLRPIPSSMGFCGGGIGGGWVIRIFPAQTWACRCQMDQCTKIAV
jgi:hypothetical protein